MNQPFIREKSPLENLLQNFTNFIISPKEYMMNQQKPKEFKEIIKINKQMGKN